MIKDLLKIGFTDFLGTAISAVFWIVLATLIEPDEYGEIYYYIGIAGVASYFALIGTQNTITVYVAKKINLQSVLSLISLAIGGIAFVVIFIFSNRIDPSLILLGYIVNTLALGDLLGRKAYTSYVKYFLTQKILLLLLGFGFYYLFGVEGVLFALALSYIAYTIRVYRGLKERKINFSLLKPNFEFIRNNYVLAISEGVKTPITTLIIAPLLGFTVLGNYFLAMQVFGILLIAAGILKKYTISHDATGNPNTELKRMSIILSVIVAIIGFILSPIIIPEFFPKYSQVVDAIQIMCFSSVPVIISSVYISKFLGSEKSRPVLLSKLISLGVLILGTVILGPIMGIIGLATAWLLCTMIEASILAIMNFKLKKEEKL